MRKTVIILILILLCSCTIGTAEEIDERQNITKSAETAKESMSEAFSAIIYAFDATMKALDAIYAALIDIWNIIAPALESAQSTLEATEIHILDDSTTNTN